MITALILAATVTATPVKDVAVTTTSTTNVVVKKKYARLRAARHVKTREEMTPVEAWHNFCRRDGKVDIPKDTRPKAYKKEKPNPHERKPRK